LSQATEEFGIRFPDNLFASRLPWLDLAGATPSSRAPLLPGEPGAPPLPWLDQADEEATSILYASSSSSPASPTPNPASESFPCSRRWVLFL
jgi:hypothetical protein